MASKDLGDALYRARSLKDLSLKAVAGPADISSTYLQKLERGEVKDPSPHVLHRLAEQLDLPYPELMQLAGYVVPASGRRSSTRQRGGPISHALSSEPLTEEEATALAEYLAFLRHQRRTARS
jgi:HTH-type transcriptional regulator, competence development regulator